MLLGKKRELLAEGDKSGTPKASRKIVPFDKYVTAKDQIELIEKDIAGGFKFQVVRHRLSGGEQRGVLIVGVTALSFLNNKEKIVFCHPYRVITSYRVNTKQQLEYSVEIDKGKTLVYLFDTAEAAAVVTSIDRNSLRLEKVMAAGSGSNSGATRSPAVSGANQAVPLFDAEGKHAAAGVQAPVVAPKTKIASIGGMRFNVKIMRPDGAEHRVVAILNEEGLILVDPSAESRNAGGTQSMACQRFPWPEVISTTAGEKEVTLVTALGKTVIRTADAHSLQEEINRQAGNYSTDTGSVAIDRTAALIATAARLAVTHGSQSPEMYGVVERNMHGIKSKEYAPGAFAAARQRYNLSDQFFVDDWTSDLLRRRELTPGLRNGKAVVHSKSGMMVAMELSKEECASFAKHLESYFAYMQQQQGASLLVRVVGLQQADNVFFMIYLHAVAQNLPVPVTTYDIQPSGQRVAPPGARGKAHSHLLERDFLLDHRTVFCGYREKKRALIQIAQDASFLAKLGFSQFTLQVSVAALDESSLPAVKAWIAAAEAKGHTGMFLSPLGDELCVVSMTQVASEVKPEEGYAQELYNFAKKRVFSSPDATVADLAWEKLIVAQLSKQQPTA